MRNQPSSRTGQTPPRAQTCRCARCGRRAGSSLPCNETNRLQPRNTSSFVPAAADATFDASQLDRSHQDSAGDKSGAFCGAPPLQPHFVSFRIQREWQMAVHA